MFLLWGREQCCLCTFVKGLSRVAKTCTQLPFHHFINTPPYWPFTALHHGGGFMWKWKSTPFSLLWKFSYTITLYFLLLETKAERNYYIRNRKQLVIKVVLQEWRHRLEGADYPFLILTDQRNLKYVKSAKMGESSSGPEALFSHWYSHHDQDPRAQMLVQGYVKVLRKNKVVNPFFLSYGIVAHIRQEVRDKRAQWTHLNRILVLQGTHLFPRLKNQT